MCSRSSIRAPIASSARTPQTASQGTPRCRARVAISDDELADQALLVEPALAGDHRPRGAHPPVELDRVEHERGAADQLGAERRPQSAGEAARGAGHLDPARVPGHPPRLAVQSRGQSLDRVGIGALLRPEHARRVLERGAHVAQHDQAWRPEARRRDSIAPIAPAPPSVVALPPTPSRTVPRAGGDRGRDQLAGSGRRRRERVAVARRDQPQTGRGRGLDDRRAAVLGQQERRVQRTARAARGPRPCAARRRTPGAAPRAFPRRRRRPGTGRPAGPPPRSPAPTAAATSVAENVPLNESGATNTVSRTPGIGLTAPVSGILCGRCPPTTN